MILIGYDGIAKSDICNWIDSLVAITRPMVSGPRVEGANGIEFKCEFRDGALTNRYAFDPASGKWVSTIRQGEKPRMEAFLRGHVYAVWETNPTHVRLFGR